MQTFIIGTIVVVVILAWCKWAGWAEENMHVSAKARKAHITQLWIAMTLVLLMIWFVYTVISNCQFYCH